MSSKPTANNGKIGSISDHVTLYPVEGSNGDGWTSDPPSAAPEGAPREGIPRYRIDEDGLLDEYPAGLIVTYPDHLSALRALTEERDRLNEELDRTEQDRDKWKSSQQYFYKQLDKEKKAWCDAAAEVGRVTEERDRALDALREAYEFSSQVAAHPWIDQTRLPSWNPEKWAAILANHPAPATPRKDGD